MECRLWVQSQPKSSDVSIEGFISNCLLFVYIKKIYKRKIKNPLQIA